VLNYFTFYRQNAGSHVHSVAEFALPTIQLIYMHNLMYSTDTT